MTQRGGGNMIYAHLDCVSLSNADQCMKRPTGGLLAFAQAQHVDDLEVSNLYLD